MTLEQFEKSQPIWKKNVDGFENVHELDFYADSINAHGLKKVHEFKNYS